jgi:hypothetical protein
MGCALRHKFHPNGNGAGQADCGRLEAGLPGLAGRGTQRLMKLPIRSSAICRWEISL